MVSGFRVFVLCLVAGCRFAGYVAWDRSGQGGSSVAEEC